MIEICCRRDCKIQAIYPHYVDESPIPHTDNRVDWRLEEIKHSRGNKCWRCGVYLTPEDLDHSFCNPCWDLSMEHYYEPDDNAMCVFCGEVEEHKYHLPPQPYVPDYMEEPD